MYQFHSPYHNHITLLSTFFIFFLWSVWTFSGWCFILLTDGRLLKIQSVTKLGTHDEMMMMTIIMTKKLHVTSMHFGTFFSSYAKVLFGAFLEEKVSNVHSTKHQHKITYHTTITYKNIIIVRKCVPLSSSSSCSVLSHQLTISVASGFSFDWQVSSWPFVKSIFFSWKMSSTKCTLLLM